jgi:hypothetical protein
MNWKVLLGVIWALLASLGVALLIFSYQVRGFGMGYCNFACYIQNWFVWAVAFATLIFFIGGICGLYRPELKSKVALFFILLPLLPGAFVAWFAVELFLNS